jgi:hypothetical protein
VEDEKLEFIGPVKSVNERIRYFKKYIPVCQCFLLELERLKRKGRKIRFIVELIYRLVLM